MLESRNKHESLCLEFPQLLTYWSDTNKTVWPVFLTMADFWRAMDLNVSCPAAKTQQFTKRQPGAVLSVGTLNSGYWTAMMGLISSNFSYRRCIH